VPKILVADDNANIQKMVALSFEDRGVEVVCVGNGEAAVRRIPDVNPDLVLADIFMPVRNGYEVCEFVKKDSRFSHVPVILLVGAFDPLDEKEARRVGADGVLKKPFVPPDPLIAMVMSALEKNPKLVVELAKTREAKQELAQDLHTISEPATSIRTEPKPLPSFPDPTPEEENLLYTSGTGSRSLEDVSAGKANAKESQPPIPEFDQAVEDESDSSATLRDWRRNAMDIEIPPDVNLPAFVSGDELDSPIFPSERDVPPRYVSAPKPVEEAASPVASQKSVPVESPLVEAPAPSVSASDSGLFAPVESEPFKIDSAARPSPHEPNPTAIGEPAPASEPAPSHWMDQLAQVSPGQPSNDWMSALSEQTLKGPISALRQTREDEDPFRAPHVEMNSKPEAQSTSGVSLATEPLGKERSGEDAFFVDEPAPSLPNTDGSSRPQHLTGPSSEPEAETTIEPTAIESVPVAPSREEGLEVDSESGPAVAFQDPNLVQPPPVHVTPEPLLVDEQSDKAAHYGADPRQDLQPTYSFFAPPFPAAAREPSVTGNTASALDAAPAPEAEPAEAEGNERIPTGPPPNREALAEIPFLTPPPDFFTHPAEPAPDRAADPQTVDAVVQKVLEKLQPQLQDLLSQGVLKPLVENLLQSELTKKNE
jgi:CheY-like chemotaxis protein